MAQATLKMPIVNSQLAAWDEQMMGLSPATPVLMIAVVPGDVPQPLILTGKDLEPKTIMQILDVVTLQLKRQLAWDKVKEIFQPEE